MNHKTVFKSKHDIQARDAAGGAAQRAPEPCTIQLHNRARGGSFSREETDAKIQGGVVRSDFGVFCKH